MFLRKLFNGENKAGWIVIDLIIVIIGVYSAFLIQSYSEQRFNDREKDKVMTALKYELEAFRLQFPQFADFMVRYHERIKDDDQVEFGGWRYIEPQYAYQIVEYAIRLENNEIIDFELYNVLQKLHVRIRQLEHVERLITEYSGRYKIPIETLPKDHPSNLERNAENLSNLSYFKLYVRSRPRNLRGVTTVSEDALEIIDVEIGFEKAREIEMDILAKNGKVALNFAPTFEETITVLDELFPKLNREEIEEIMESFKDEEQDSDN